jgi:hypothetical protein
MQAGYVYIFHCDVIVIPTGAVPYKIGKSVDPSARVRDFAGYPADVTLVHSIRTNDAGWLEQHLQAYFLDRRAKAEWFALTEDDLHLLQRINILDRVPAGFIQGFPVVAAPEDRCVESENREPSLFPEGNYPLRTIEEAHEALKNSGWCLSWGEALFERLTLHVLVCQKDKNVICAVGRKPSEVLNRACRRAESVGLLT